jgi:hypothetical protein
MLSFVEMKSYKMVFTSRYVAWTSATFFELISLEGLVLEDLIRNVHTLFDGRPSTSLLVPSPPAETTSTFPSGSFSVLSRRSSLRSMSWTLLPYAKGSLESPPHLPSHLSPPYLRMLLRRVTSHHHRPLCQVPYQDFRRQTPLWEG